MFAPLTEDLLEADVKGLISIKELQVPVHVRVAAEIQNVGFFLLKEEVFDCFHYLGPAVGVLWVVPKILKNCLF